MQVRLQNSRKLLKNMEVSYVQDFGSRELAGNIYQVVVEAPRVAKHCLPGQFVIVKADAVGERIPRRLRL